ncbi:hypothetical protein [Spiroplasma chrysopicola]|uniref:Lipoprotein n=1 Tax=Spiroplasma chrysopicola DF-1 TaxID=1276227 RepID=R4UHH0_9MOLU|nr:hypothetical protein [Spiroplasma chrysopicola]AGM24776.1 hypothetical protein SCHRY_v1c01910 [Spiroplasma chrysopicola DF-1]
MRKLLSVLTSFTIGTTSITSVVACGADKGRTVPMFIYNGDNEFLHDPTPNEELGIQNAFGSGKDADDKPFETMLNNGSFLPSGLLQLVLPLMYGINLSKDNWTSQKGAHWTEEQLNSSLSQRKDDLIANAGNDEQKELWTSFFNNYSTTDDSYFTQIGIVAKDNQNLVNDDKSVTQTTPNFTRSGEKEWVKPPKEGDKFVQTPNSLRVLAPVANAIDWLNASADYNQGKDQIDKSTKYQSTRYAFIQMKDVKVTFEFTNKDKIYTFSAVAHNLTGVANYIAYKNPNNDKEYAHQWFFIGYSFYDLATRQDDDYHKFNVTVPSLQIGTEVALGYVLKGDDKGIVDDETEKTIKDQGTLPLHTKEYSFPEFSWEIDPTSIKSFK